MVKTAWRPLGSVDLPTLREARLQAHYAAQWLARVAGALIPPQPGDAHTNLGWDAVLDGFTIHELKPGLRLGLSVSALSLTIADSTFALDGRTDADARTWLGAQLQRHGLDAASVAAASPWEMPQHPLGGGAAYRRDAAALRELAAWFANADASLDAVRARQAAQASAVRCWPHHFDIATLIPLGGSGEQARSAGVGLSPGDEHYDEPYFYVSPWPYPEADKLPRLPSPGHWHTQNFTAAIVTASGILAAKDRQTGAEAFLSAAVDAAVDAIG